MGTRYKICEEQELENGDWIIEQIEGKEIGIFRLEDEWHALANYCPHQAGPLCEGHLSGQTTTDEDGDWIYEPEEKNIVCPWHAWKFDVTNGKNIDIPFYAVPTYDVEKDGSDIFVVL